MWLIQFIIFINIRKYQNIYGFIFYNLKSKGKGRQVADNLNVQLEFNNIMLISQQVIVVVCLLPLGSRLRHRFWSSKKGGNNIGNIHKCINPLIVYTKLQNSRIMNHIMCLHSFILLSDTPNLFLTSAFMLYNCFFTHSFVITLL